MQKLLPVILFITLVCKKNFTTTSK